MLFIKNKFYKVVIISSIPLLFTACEHFSSRPLNPLQAQCVGNAYLQKYGCSIERVQQAAENGDADAQYALGYMYFYGINTIQDAQTATLWMHRAAAQGQPLAIKALSLLKQGRHLNELHHGYAIIGGGRAPSMHQPSEDVAKLNTMTPDRPIIEHLPAYGTGKNRTRKPVLKSLSGSDTKLKSNNPNTGATPESTGQRRIIEEPISQVPRTGQPPHRKVNRFVDARLARNARPNSPYLQAAVNSTHVVARSSLSSSEKQLLKVKPQYYTLQLMGSHDLRAIQDFMRRHELEGKAKYYRATFRHEPWYMLVYGTYSSISKAATAAKQLPTTIRTLHPWVKSYRVVQKEILTRKVFS